MPERHSSALDEGRIYVLNKGDGVIRVLVP